MIDPAIGEVLRGLVGGLCMPPIFWLAYPLMLLWLRWSQRWLPQGGLAGALAIVEIIALGLATVVGGALVAGHVGDLLGLPGLPHDPSVYRAGPYRIWPADVLLYAAGMVPGIAATVAIARLPPLRRPREAWQRWTGRLSP